MKTRGFGSLLGYFVVTYAIMWACFIPVAVTIPATTPVGRFLLILGAFAPGITALAFTYRAEGGAGVRALLSRVTQGRVAWGWYRFAVAFMAMIKLTAALLHRLATGAWPPFGDTPLIVIPFAIALSTPFQAGEEIGWRGYALPRLAERIGLAPASLLLGLIWAVWHLPQFFIRDGGSYGQSFFVFVLAVVPLSVAIAWLYVRTQGSLLLPMIFHAAINNSQGIVPSATPGGTGIFGF